MAPILDAFGRILQPGQLVAYSHQYGGMRQSLLVIDKVRETTSYGKKVIKIRCRWASETWEWMRNEQGFHERRDFVAEKTLHVFAGDSHRMIIIPWEWLIPDTEVKRMTLSWRPLYQNQPAVT